MTAGVSARPPAVALAGRRSARLRSLLASPRARAALPYAIVGAAFLATRLALLWRFPPFVDETIYADWAQRVANDPAARFVALTQAKGPLFTWLGSIPIHAGVDRLIAVRLVSLASGAVTLTMVALVARRLGGRRTAIVAAGLYVVSPLFLVHDVIGIYDPLAAAIVMLALYLELRLAESPRFDLAFVLGFVLAAGVLTKQTTSVAFVLLPLSLLMFDWRAPRRRIALWVGCAAVALLLAWLGQAILKLSPLYQQRKQIAAATGLPYRSLSDALERPFHYLSTGWEGFHPGLVGYLTLPLIAVLALGVVVALRERWRLALILVVAGGASVLAALTLATWPAPRYFLAGVPPAIVLMAYGLDRAAAFAKDRWGARRAVIRAGAAAAGVAILIPALLLDVDVLHAPATAKYPGIDDVQYATGWPSGGAFHPLARVIERRSQGVPEPVGAAGQLNYAALGYYLGWRYPVVPYTDPAFRGGRFVVTGGEGAPAAGMRLVAEARRPRGGQPLTLWEIAPKGR